MISFNEIFILVILIVLSGIFSASETALVAISRFNVELFAKKKRKGSIALSKLKENPHKMLITLLICNNVVNIAGSVLATTIALKVFPNNALAYATGIMTFLILVFGEIVPKSLATTHSGSISVKMAPIIYWISIVLYPIIFFFDLITSKLFRVKKLTHRITEEEVRNIVDIAKEEGGIDKEEKEMIHKIFKFDDIDVDEIKVPRIDMISIEVGQKLKDALELINKENFSRLPVYEGSNDKIVGVFYFKDALEFIKKKKFDIPIEELMRKPMFIPETKKIDETLKLFQKKKQQLAIIIDEHGGVSGLVSMEDILEEIVGEIRDETERVEPEFRKTDKKTWKVLGKADMDDVNKKLKLKLIVEEDYDTLSGYILNSMGKIPKVGEEIDLTVAKIIVKKVEGNRIIDVLIKKK